MMNQLDRQVSKLIKCLNSGIFDSTVITGTNTDLKAFHKNLIRKLPSESYSVESLDLTDSEHLISNVDNRKEINLVVVLGLEHFLPMENRTFALRTILDTGKHQGLKSVIFCEANHYAQHFTDLNAPFYKFCLCMPLSTE